MGRRSGRFSKRFVRLAGFRSSSSRLGRSTLPEACALCGGNRFVMVGNRAQRCECLTRLITAKRIRDARIPERYEDCRIGTFQLLPGPYEQSQAAAMLAASAFVEHARTKNQDGLVF